MSKLEDIKAMAKTRGFFWPSAEIYKSSAGLWSYGPLGVALKQNLISEWRKAITGDMLEIDGSQIMPAAVFNSSGHLSSFQDPITECKKCGSFRADKLIEKVTGKIIPEALPAKEFDKLITKHKVSCPNCKGKLSNVEMFNLMVKTGLGTSRSEENYLRPETCQSIFVDFPQVYRSMRGRLPMGIAQVGKAFRNEISPRQSILRTREFNQAEIEVFFNPKSKFEKFSEVKKQKLPLMIKNKINTITVSDAVTKKILVEIEAYYLAQYVKFFQSLSIPLKNIRLRQVGDDEKPFYAKSAWDLEVNTSLGWIEVCAHHNRGDHDLKSHSKGSGKDLSVIDVDKKVLPHVWESSMGIDRLLFCILDLSFVEDKVGGEKRSLLKFAPHIAPYKVAVFPLVKKDGLKEKSQEVFNTLSNLYPCFLDISGSIGKRYRRQDEVGTPFCLTIDYDTMKDNTVTVRERDSTKQSRIKISELVNYLCKKVM